METSRRAERIEWQSPCALDGAQVLLVDNCARRWTMFHETYTICTGLSIGRAAEWAYRGKRHMQTADGVMLIEPGEAHSNTRITDPASFRVLMVDPATIERISAELGSGSRSPHLRLAQVQGGPVHRAFVSLHRSLEGGATPLEQQSRFVACVRILLEHCSERPAAPLGQACDRPALRRAKEYINEHCCEAIRLDDVVAAAGNLSRFHLVRAFTKEFGLPPHAYQLHMRVAKARKLLESGKPIADVAALLGFADQSHFTRHFRGLLGITPGAYLRWSVGSTRKAGPRVSDSKL
jgi:AraC-like DNA-binding protein